MPGTIEEALTGALGDSCFIGQIAIQKTDRGFTLFHRDDGSDDRLQIFRQPDDALEIARYDDAGNYRPLKTAPNLRHGWRLEVGDPGELHLALDYFYPGRLAMLAAWQ